MHVLSVNQFDRPLLDELFEVARELKNRIEAGEVLDLMKGKILSNVFYEPSTRTRWFRSLKNVATFFHSMLYQLLIFCCHAAAGWNGHAVGLNNFKCEERLRKRKTFRLELTVNLQRRKSW